MPPRVGVAGRRTHLTGGEQVFDLPEQIVPEAEPPRPAPGCGLAVRAHRHPGTQKINVDPRRFDPGRRQEGTGGNLPRGIAPSRSAGYDRQAPALSSGGFGVSTESPRTPRRPGPAPSTS